MLKNVLVVVFIFFSLNINSQTKKIPEGYSKIILDGKTAYMNFETGDVIRTGSQQTINEQVLTNDVTYSSNSNLTNTHIVAKGENLYRIGLKYGLSVNAIKKLNNLNSTELFVGQQLKINNNVENVQVNSNETINADNYYIVMRGDTVYAIATDFDLTVAELKRLNNLHSNKLSVGQRLLVK